MVTWCSNFFAKSRSVVLMALMCWPSVAVAAPLARVLLCAVAEQLGDA